MISLNQNLYRTCDKIWVSRDLVDMVMKYISSLSYTFLHNGGEFDSVVPQRGLRRGDSISLYIYVMCVERLSAIIRINEEASILHSCVVVKGESTISRLLFADDSCFFFITVES